MKPTLAKEFSEENARLREELGPKAQETPQTSPIARHCYARIPASGQQRRTLIFSNVSIAWKEVFGKQIVDRDY